MMLEWWTFIEPTNSAQMHRAAVASVSRPCQCAADPYGNTAATADPSIPSDSSHHELSGEEARSAGFEGRGDLYPVKSTKSAKSLFCRVVGPSRPHPEGNLSKTLSRKFKRHALRLLRRHASRHGRRTSRRFRASARTDMRHNKTERNLGTAQTVQEAYGHMAMKDLPWGKYLNSKHREDVVRAWENEI